MLAIFIRLDPAALRIVIASFVLCLSAVAHAQTPASQRSGTGFGCHLRRRSANPRRPGGASRPQRQRRHRPDEGGCDRTGDVPGCGGRALPGPSHPGRICRRRVGTFRRPWRHDRTGPDGDASLLRSRERRSDPAGQLAHREPAAGRGQRSADRFKDGHSAAGRRRLSVAADPVAVHRARSRRTAARERRRADHRRTAGEQRQLERSLDGRFRSRAAERRGRIGGGLVESIRRGIRPLLNERHAGQNQTRQQRVAVQARQPDAELRPRLHPSFRAPARLVGTDQAGSPAVRAVPPVPLCADACEESAG